MQKDLLTASSAPPHLIYSLNDPPPYLSGCSPGRKRLGLDGLGAGSAGLWVVPV
jgi:hypothetical protein